MTNTASIAPQFGKHYSANTGFVKEVKYKFNEEALVAELKAYIDGTYTKHYVGNDNIQAFELIVSAGHGLGFAIGDVIKYAARYGKKGGHNRDDLLKILHYTILALYVHDKEKA